MSMLAEKIIPNRVPRDHIKVGNIVWYSNEYSQWNCPAEIIEVDEQAWYYEDGGIRGIFRVKSLDDCKDQKQEYSFNIERHAPESRTSMFVPSHEELERWHRVEGGELRSTSLEERDGSYVVKFEAKPHPVNQWALERWCARNGASATYGLDKEMVTQLRFPTMDDAALCRMTFSQGLKWSMII